MNFKSDNTSGVHPYVMDALFEVNKGYFDSYGQDEVSFSLKKKLSDFFETEVDFFLTNTGTISNCLALASLLKPYSCIFAHKNAHIISNESSAPEFYTSCRIIPIEGALGKVDINAFKNVLSHQDQHPPHSLKAGCLSLTQTTEVGGVYTLDELSHLCSVAKNNNLPVHMDGARFSNALASLRCSASEVTWKRGVDVLSFGLTKNGGLSAEAVVFFNKNYSESFEFLHKRSGQLMSKTRFFSAQFKALLEDDLLIQNAQSAHDKAQKLALVFERQGLPLGYPVETNQIFVYLCPTLAKKLEEEGVGFYLWENTYQGSLYRFVTSFNTCDEDIDLFEKTLKKVNA